MVDHETIDEAIDAIELLIRRGEMESLQEASEELADLLEAHFAQEEQSPMFTSLPEHSVPLAQKIDTLLREHKEMRAEVRALLESDEIVPRLLALMKKLDAHEKIELALLEHAFGSVTRT